MKTSLKRLCVTFIATVAVMSGASATANAAANPFTAASACAYEFGGSWYRVSDGHRPLYHYGTHIGDVHLMYDGRTGRNCVATIKRAYVGQPSDVIAHLQVQGQGHYHDRGNYKYYAAVQARAVDTCVQYYGEMLYRSWVIMEGRFSWGNCG